MKYEIAFIIGNKKQPPKPIIKSRAEISKIASSIDSLIFTVSFLFFYYFHLLNLSY